MEKAEMAGDGEPHKGPAAPVHVAIIMDGNGRWAAARGLPRFEGHRRGVEALRQTVRAAGELGIGYLTVYSFSTENWLRPEAEVGFLMGLLRRFLRDDLAELHANNVRIRVVGDDAGIESDILAMLRDAQHVTRANTGLTLVVAFNYGSRQELACAMRAIAGDVAAGLLEPQAITPELIGKRLWTADIPDPDLIIRTSGEQRLSNFLLWQAAYAEFVFLPLHWPDFNRAALQMAMDEFARRDRRYGGLGEGEGPEPRLVRAVSTAS